MPVELMQWRCPDAVPIGTIMLRDWRLVFCDHATIEPAPGSVVPGCLWNITGRCEEALRLDGYGWERHDLAEGARGEAEGRRRS